MIRMVIRRSTLASIGAGTATALVVLLLRWDHRPSSALLHPDRQSLVTAPPESAFAAVDAIERSGLTAVESALQGIDQLERWAANPTKPLANNSRCEWPSGIERTSWRLASKFLFGKLQGKALMRHAILNDRDVPLCPEEMTEFLDIVERYDAVVAPLWSTYREIKIREMIEIADSGQVKPWRRDENVDAEISRRAAILVAERRMSHAEAMREAEKGIGSRGQPPAVNQMWHDGECYLASDFPPLPRSKAFFESLKVVIGEYAAWVMSWFVAKGLCSDPGKIREVLEDIATAPAR